MKCVICGEEFNISIDKHYVSIGPEIKRTGLTALAGGKDEESWLYDTFDCPHCGCQNIAQKRKRDFYRELKVEEAITLNNECVCGCENEYEPIDKSPEALNDH